MMRSGGWLGKGNRVMGTGLFVEGLFLAAPRDRAPSRPVPRAEARPGGGGDANDDGDDVDR